MVLVAVVVVALAVSAFGDGFRNPPEGAAVLGRGGMRLTEGNDPSAVIHNPASLMDLEEAELMAAATIAFIEVEFTDALTGMTTETKDPWRILPSVSAAWPLEDDRYVAGLGLHFPHGQFSRWDSQSILKGRSPYFAEMSTMDLTPVLATRIGDNVYVGAGPDLIWSTLEFKQKFPFSMMMGDPTIPDGTIAADGDGFALGAHAGITWLVSDAHRLALTYYSPFCVDYKGDYSMEDGVPPDMLPPPLSADSDFESEIEFPTIVAIGYGWQATKALRLEANVEWLEHSRNEKIVVDIENNNVLLNPPTATDPLAPSVMPQDWDDIWTVGAGADWQFAPDWVARTGWTYLPTPVSEDFMAPTLPDSDRHLLCVGMGHTMGRQTLDLAYVYAIADDATVSNPMNPVNGTYEFTSQVIGVSYTCAF
jgi:long-chain fatty acid transport protein